MFCWFGSGPLGFCYCCYVVFKLFFLLILPTMKKEKEKKKSQKFQAAKFTLLSRFCVDFKNTDKSRRAMCDLTLFLVDTVHLLRLPVMKVRS